MQQTQKIQDLNPKKVDDVFETVSRIFDRNFERNGANPKSVKASFCKALDGIKKAIEPERQLKSIAKSAVLSAGRYHGNVLEVVSCVMETLEATPDRQQFQSQSAKEQALLGLAEGTCQLGPIVHSRFLEVANTYLEGAEEIIRRERRQADIVELQHRSIIIPYENSLNFGAKTTPKLQDPPSEQEQSDSQAPPMETKTGTWTRNGNKTIFSRLTDAVGHFFGS